MSDEDVGQPAPAAGRRDEGARVLELYRGRPGLGKRTVRAGRIHCARAGSAGVERAAGGYGAGYARVLDSLVVLVRQLTPLGRWFWLRGGLLSAGAAGVLPVVVPPDVGTRRCRAPRRRFLPAPLAMDTLQPLPRCHTRSGREGVDCR